MDWEPSQKATTAGARRRASWFLTTTNNANDRAGGGPTVHPRADKHKSRCTSVYSYSMYGTIQTALLTSRLHFIIIFIFQQIQDKDETGTIARMIATLW